MNVEQRIEAIEQSLQRRQALDVALVDCTRHADFDFEASEIAHRWLSLCFGLVGDGVALKEAGAIASAEVFGAVQ